MQVVADLQLHSRFARAVSSSMNIPTMSEWGGKKGIDLLSTADWTHPIWFRELRSHLEEAGEGIYKAKGSKENSRFLLSTEISSIYSQEGRTRRIHTLIFSPSFAVSEKINKELIRRGANLMSDGRPIVGLSAEEVARIALEADERCLIIPAHAWTPWFSLYGSKSGFDSIQECFGDLEDKIYAIETGLSSDPAMNWRVEDLDNRAILSFSDAHSPQKMGREATVFELEEMSYESVRKAIIAKSKKDRILYTIEFYPEEGKYHFTGHRKCGVSYSPGETKKLGTTCPVCGKPLTVGVMSRVEFLAGREIELLTKRNAHGVDFIFDKDGKRPPYTMIVPLTEILSNVFSVGVGTKTVNLEYEKLIGNLGSEFEVLLKTPLPEIKNLSGERVAEAIKKVRQGDVKIKPGFDGVFGEVSIKLEEKKDEEGLVDGDQSSLF